VIRCATFLLVAWMTATVSFPNAPLDVREAGLEIRGVIQCVMFNNVNMTEEIVGTLEHQLAFQPAPIPRLFQLLSPQQNPQANVQDHRRPQFSSLDRVKVLGVQTIIW